MADSSSFSQSAAASSNESDLPLSVARRPCMSKTLKHRPSEPVFQNHPSRLLLITSCSLLLLLLLCTRTCHACVASVCWSAGQRPSRLGVRPSLPSPVDTAESAAESARQTKRSEARRRRKRQHARDSRCAHASHTSREQSEPNLADRGLTRQMQMLVQMRGPSLGASHATAHATSTHAVGHPFFRRDVIDTHADSGARVRSRSPPSHSHSSSGEWCGHAAGPMERETNSSALSGGGGGGSRRRDAEFNFDRTGTSQPRPPQATEQHHTGDEQRAREIETAIQQVRSKDDMQLRVSAATRTSACSRERVHCIHLFVLCEVDEYCRQYIAHLSAELLQTSPLHTGTTRGTSSHSSGVVSAVAAAAAAAGSGPSTAAPSRSDLLQVSVRSILSHPAHLPSSLPRLTPLRTSAAVTGVGALTLPASEQRVDGGSRARKSVATSSAAVKREEASDGSCADDDDDGEDEQDIELPFSDRDDEEYSPHARRASSLRHRGSRTGGILSAIFSSGTSVRGRSLKRKVADDTSEHDSDVSADSPRHSRAAGRGGRGRVFAPTVDLPPATAAPLTDSHHRRSKLPLRAVVTLRQYFIAHVDRPFPSDQGKRDLAAQCGLNFKQVADWFTNTRKVRHAHERGEEARQRRPHTSEEDTAVAARVKLIPFLLVSASSGAPQRFWRPYCDHLASVGCALHANPWAVCSCGIAADEHASPSQPKKQKIRSSHGADEVPRVVSASGAHESTSRVDRDATHLHAEHAWIKMWN